jgi:mannose-1-phosphate guanylyltransferase/phosphomannomutase
LARAIRRENVVFGGDGRGGFVVADFSPAIDGLAAFVALCGMVARTRLTLSEINRRIPAAHIHRQTVPTPWAAKGMVMRAVVEAAGERKLDTTDGVRVIEDDGAWVLVLPDPSEPVTHLWVEGPNEERALELLDRWAMVVERSEP